LRITAFATAALLSKSAQRLATQQAAAPSAQAWISTAAAGMINLGACSLQLGYVLPLSRYCMGGHGRQSQPCQSQPCHLSWLPGLLPVQTSKAVEKAIKTSPLSLNATTEGSEVLVKLPRMTQENIERMIKLVHMEAEGANQSIRRARQKGMDAIKKAFKAASQDEKKRQEKEVCW
jgi:ribosome recycling factor